RDYTMSVPVFFFLSHTAPTESYTLSLHDALPISWESATSTDLFTSLDVGMNVSAGMRVRTGKESYLNGAFNYYHGFSNIFESAPIEIRNRAIGITFAMFFPLPRIN